MRIIIYNSSSFGGCFDYGKALHSAYQQHSEIENAEWWLPKNSKVENEKGIKSFSFETNLSFQEDLGGKSISFIGLFLTQFDCYSDYKLNHHLG